MRSLSHLFIVILFGFGASAAPSPGPINLVDQLLAWFDVPEENARDPTNLLSGDSDAIKFGTALFGDKNLSASGAMSCATCHKPELNFTDEHRLSFGRFELRRRTPTLVGLSRAKWFSWDGKADTLWGQIASVLEDREEMAGDRDQIVRYILSRDDYRASLTNLRRKYRGEKDPSTVADFVLVGKALAAYIETIRPALTKLDKFLLDARTNPSAALSQLSAAESAGMELFFGRARCSVCHSGPEFTDQDFHNIGLRNLPRTGGPDRGRYGGYQAALRSEFSGAGHYSDDSHSGAEKVSRAVIDQLSWAAFKTPSLRNVCLRRFFMHDGRFSSLQQVIDFYSRLEDIEIGHHQEGVLRPLNLSAEEAASLEAFLCIL